MGDILDDASGIQFMCWQNWFSELPAPIYSTLNTISVDKKSTDIDNHLNLMRIRKDASELILHEKGAAICDDLFEKLGAELSDNKPLWQTQNGLENRAKLEGADYCKTWLTVSPCADYPRYWPMENQHLPRQGDQVLIGVALTVDGHWAHGIRMGSIGPAKNDHKRLWQLVMDMMAEGTGQLQTGNSLNSCEEAMNKVLVGYKNTEKLGDFTRFRNGLSTAVANKTTGAAI